MLEQSVHHPKDPESDQQTTYYIVKGEMNYENNRHRCSGGIQCRN